MHEVYESRSLEDGLAHCYIDTMFNCAQVGWIDAQRC